MPEPLIALRPARQDDAPAIAMLATQLGYPVSAAEATARLSQLAQMPNHCVLVADLEGQVAGWAHVEHRVNLESGDRAELMGLVVDSRFRRAGIGKRLVEAVEQWAAARQLGLIVVRSNIARQASHAFYQQVGYKALKTQHVYQKGVSDNAHRT